MARGRLFVGTSGFGYPSWKPEFYPAELKQKEFLRYYATRLSSVEINNTFYRMPTEKLLRSWLAETAESFVLSLKAPQRITHVARLKLVDGTLAHFLALAETLGSRLGCLLFQCPPTLRYAAELLDPFLAALAEKPHLRAAMEFRHPSWKSGEAEARLRAAGVAWCVADTDEEDAPVIRTAERFTYYRLRKSQYSPDALERWAGTVGVVLEAGADAYVYFKHEEDPAGARYASWLQAKLG
jgi:uncharacterized protein YecE (DUF72 family)